MANWRHAQYLHHVRFSHDIDQQQYADWAITALFYAAIQFIDTVLQKQYPSLPTTHKARSTAVQRCAATKPIASDYYQLKGLSEDARYNHPYSTFGCREIQTAQQWLASIENRLTPYLP